MDVYQGLDFFLFMPFIGILTGLFISVLKDWWL